MKNRRNSFTCSKCGKKLIERKRNGLWFFVFGRSENRDPPVQIEIHGHIRMRCLRSSCRRKHPDHWNVFNFLPEPIDQVESGTKLTTAAAEKEKGE